MKHSKPILIISLAAALLFLFTGCGQLAKDLDIIGQGSVTAFETLLSAVPPAAEAAGGWSLSAPDGSAKIRWGGNQGPALVVDAAPFLAAGLDVAKLPESYAYDGQSLHIGARLDVDASASATALEAYEAIVRQAPAVIGFHGEMNHFGLSVGNGNLFEWAQDMDANDKDMVFALDPDALAAAGVDSADVAGWTLATVNVHENGRLVKAEKLLKPFNLQ